MALMTQDINQLKVRAMLRAKFGAMFGGCMAVPSGDCVSGVQIDLVDSLQHNADAKDLSKSDLASCLEALKKALSDHVVDDLKQGCTIDCGPLGVHAFIGVTQQVSGRIAHKVAVVTGGAQGIGHGIASGLIEEGAVIVLLDINEALVTEKAAEFNQQYGTDRALGLRCDITNSESIQQAIGGIVSAYGGIDIFVANAGVLKAGSVMELEDKDFDFVTNVNYTGFFKCVKQIAPIMMAQGIGNPEAWSDIIQINSKSGLVGSNKNGAYAGGKFGGIGLVQSFAMELVEHQIKVNAICPGNFYDGPLWSDPDNGLFVQYLRSGKVPGAKTIEDVRHAYELKTPMRRGCMPKDLIRALLYLVEQQFETGQALPVTGGQVMLH